MSIIFEFIELVLDMLNLVLPEKMAEKVNKGDTNSFIKCMVIILFTFIYGAFLLGLSFSLTLPVYTSYKIVAVILIIFLLYCLFKFYYLIFKR